MFHLKLRRSAVTAVVLASLALPSIALADAAPASNAGLTPGTAIPLNGPISGTIAGNPGGAYEYLQFAYPGDGSQVTLTFTVDNPAPLASGAAGFNLYQAGDLVGSSAQQTINTAAATYASSTPGPMLVQVFDYDATNPVAYTLTPQGLTTTTQQQDRTSAPATASKALTGTVSGSLSANPGGSFAIYTDNSAGNSQVIDLNLVVSNTVVIANNAAGINVYDQSGNLVGTSTPTVDGNTVSVSLNQPDAATFTIQVYNYDPNVSFTYTLTPSAS